MPANQRPNIVLILVDQLRADILRAYGGALCRTPAIDALAGRARIFERAYTTLPVCSPARASVMTGLYPHNHEVISNESPLSNGTLADGAHLLSRRLEAAGYDRWYSGKWHLGGPGDLPADRGFPGQQFPGHGEGGHAFPEYRAYLKARGLEFRMVDGPHPLGWHRYGVLDGPEEAEVSAFVAEDSMAFLDRWAESREKPFFLWTNFWGPHEPYFPTADYLKLYDGVAIPPWPNFPDNGPLRPRIHALKTPPESRAPGWAFWEPAVRHYFAFMSLIDHQIGRILARIEALGVTSDTMVIFAADHGESIGAHGCQDKGHFMYEEIVRIPLMVAGPGATPGRREALVSLADFYATILEVAGVEDGGAGDGRSLMPLIGDGPVPADWRTSVVTEFHGLITPFTQRMIVDDRYKYVWNMGDIDELYDRRTDPHELANLILEAAHSGPLRRLQADLAGWMETTGDPALPYFRRHLANARQPAPA